MIRYPGLQLSSLKSLLDSHGRSSRVPTTHKNALGDDVNRCAEWIDIVAQGYAVGCRKMYKPIDTQRRGKLFRSGYPRIYQRLIR